MAGRIVTEKADPAPAASNQEHYTDAEVRAVLRACRIIAMVGASPNWNRPSYFAMKYLQEKGYRVIPVNPREAGNEILGEIVHASLKDVPIAIDMVDVFRRPDAVPEIAREAIEVGAKVLWLQLGVRHAEAAAECEAAGMKVIQNRCVKIEYGRLSGEIGWMGVNSRVISSKRGKRI
jgi:predicted CoA-binding protein